MERRIYLCNRLLTFHKCILLGLLLLSVITTNCKLLQFNPSASNLFPSLKDPVELNVRLKNVAHQRYLCVSFTEGGYRLGTKKMVGFVDPDLDFSLYYFTSEEESEVKYVLPIHQATMLTLGMTADKEIKLTFLEKPLLDDYPEDPHKLTKADSRFFRLRTSGDSYALQFLNGGDEDNYYLAVNDSNEPVVQQYNYTDYLDEMLFAIEDLDS